MSAFRLLPRLLALCLVPALVFPPFARAGTTPEAFDVLRVEAVTAYEGLPEQDGSSWARSRHGLLLGAELGEHFSVLAAGELHPSLTGGEGLAADEADLQRLRLRFESATTAVDIGRFVHLGAAGLMRVDGVGVDLDPSGPLGVALWGGRFGHPEALVLPGLAGAGAELRLSPGSLHFTGGYDLLTDTVELEHRGRVTGGWRGGTGARAMALAELGYRSELASEDVDGDDSADSSAEPGETDDASAEDGAAGELGLHGELRGSLPLGTRAQLDLGARWYGLPPASVPWSSASVLESIRPADYGVADLAVRMRPSSELDLRVSGGPTLYQVATGLSEVDITDLGAEPELETGVGFGATGKLAASYDGVGLYGSSTFVGSSWYAGGGAGVERAVGALDLGLEGGLFRFQGLDAAPAWVGEGRLQAEMRLPAQPGWGELRLALRAAAGADRLLVPWYRAGIALHGRLGTAGGGS